MVGSGTGFIVISAVAPDPSILDLKLIKTETPEADFSETIIFHSRMTMVSTKDFPDLSAILSRSKKQGI